MTSLWLTAPSSKLHYSNRYILYSIFVCTAHKVSSGRRCMLLEGGESNVSDYVFFWVSNLSLLRRRDLKTDIREHETIPASEVSLTFLFRYASYYEHDSFSTDLIKPLWYLISSARRSTGRRAGLRTASSTRTITTSIALSTGIHFSCIKFPKWISGFRAQIASTSTKKCHASPRRRTGH